MDIKRFGRRVREYRIRRHATQMELAEALYITVSEVDAIERGELDVSMELLVAIAITLRTTPNRLLIDSLPEGSVSQAFMIH